MSKFCWQVFLMIGFQNPAVGYWPSMLNSCRPSVDTLMLCIFSSPTSMSGLIVLLVSNSVMFANSDVFCGCRNRW